MTQSFKHDDVFPLIHRLITDRTDRASDYVRHSQLVDALLDDLGGGAIVAAAEATNQLDRRGTASNMVAWFSQRYTSGENKHGDLLERQKIGTTWAYRSKQTTPTSSVVVGAFAPDVDFTAIEGSPKLVTHITRERDPKLVQAKLDAVQAETGRLACECCNFDAKDRFPGIKLRIVEVHHRTMISEYKGPVKISLKDLSVLCPTCHRAIHRSGGMSVEEFKVEYFAQ